MRDWTAYVRAHLKLPALAPEREAHIVRDLAAHRTTWKAYVEAVNTVLDGGDA